VPDAVIVGAGHNGLVAAAYLARAGLSVEVFERRDIVGGACVTEELWPGVRASPGAYTLSLLRRRIIDELELAAHGLEVFPHEPYLFAPLPDGRKVVTWSEPGRTRTQLAEDWSAADADGYLEFSRRWSAAADLARPLMLEPPDRERWLEAVGEGILDGPIADEVAVIPSEEVRVPFALQGCIGTLAGPFDPGTAFVGFYHELGEAVPDRPGAWGFARGGMGAVTSALRSAAEAAGAVIHTRMPVERILVAADESGLGGSSGGATSGGASSRGASDGASSRGSSGGPSTRAYGIAFAEGREVEARVVLSNADPVRTAALAGVDPPAGWAQPGPVVKVMLLLDGLPDFPSWPGEEAWHGAIDIGFTLDELQQAADDARAGRPAAKPWIEAACQTAADPTLAPEGRHVASLFCQCFPVDVDADAAADAAIARFAKVCPQLPDRIVDRLVLGPRQLEERFGITGGHIFHGEMLAARRGARDLFDVDGLYVAGSGAHPGGAVTGAPGFLAARAVLEDLA
jgi:phytoene dehydrogenase-like protein